MAPIYAHVKVLRPARAWRSSRSSIGSGQMEIEAWFHESNES
jgi:hypothetical protein